MQNLKLQPINTVNKEKGVLFYFKMFMCKISSVLEIVIVLLLWFIIFNNVKAFSNLSLYDIIAYLIVGNLISSFSKFFLFQTVKVDFISKKSDFTFYQPIKYFFKILTSNIKKKFILFLLTVLLNLALFYFLINDILINSNLAYLSVILIMIILSFIFDFLIIYLSNLLIFWKFESRALYNILIRLRKIVSGNYFPISLLPVIFVNISLIFPFAYSFFIPAELYLKNIDLSVGLLGIGVQIFWILILYLLIKFILSYQLKDKNAVKIIKTFK
jgi:ABC-2 type transport system permease protein